MSHNSNYNNSPSRSPSTNFKGLDQLSYFLNDDISSSVCNLSTDFNNKNNNNNNKNNSKSLSHPSPSSIPPFPQQQQFLLPTDNKLTLSDQELLSLPTSSGVPSKGAKYTINSNTAVSSICVRNLKIDDLNVFDASFLSFKTHFSVFFHFGISPSCAGPLTNCKSISLFVNHVGKRSPLLANQLFGHVERGGGNAFDEAYGNFSLRAPAALNKEGVMHSVRRIAERVRSTCFALVTRAKRVEKTELLSSEVGGNYFNRKRNSSKNNNKRDFRASAADLSLTPMQYAAISGDIDAIEALARLGADVDGCVCDEGELKRSLPPRPNAGLTPLALACALGNVEAACALLRLGANTEVPLGGGRPLLFYCFQSPVLMHLICQHNKENSTIITAGTEASSQSEGLKSTKEVKNAFWDSSRDGEDVSSCIANGTQKLGKTASLSTSTKGLLLHQICDPEFLFCSIGDNSILDVPALDTRSNIRNCTLYIIEELNFNVNERAYESLRDKLLKNGVDTSDNNIDNINSSNNNNEGFLADSEQFFANKKNDYNNSANDNFPLGFEPPKYYMQTPLHLAALGGDVNLVKALLSCGADPTIPDGDGLRPHKQPGVKGNIIELIEEFLRNKKSSKDNSKLLFEDHSNLSSNMDLKQIKHFLFTAIFPNFLLFYFLSSNYMDSLLGSPVISTCACLCVALLFGISANIAMSQQRRSALLPGWLLGGHFCGIICFLTLLRNRVFINGLAQNKAEYGIVDLRGSVAAAVSASLVSPNPPSPIGWEESGILPTSSWSGGFAVMNRFINLIGTGEAFNKSNSVQDKNSSAVLYTTIPSKFIPSSWNAFNSNAVWFSSLAPLDPLVVLIFVLFVVMIVSFVLCWLSDPGSVQSTAAQRRKIYETLLKKHKCAVRIWVCEDGGGDVEKINVGGGGGGEGNNSYNNDTVDNNINNNNNTDNSGNKARPRQVFKEIVTFSVNSTEVKKYDLAKMVIKPLRSKHCSKTGECVYRFDHYCVWTGNTIGGNNHRFFYYFLVGMTGMQLIILAIFIRHYITSASVNYGLQPVFTGALNEVVAAAYRAGSGINASTESLFSLSFLSSMDKSTTVGLKNIHGLASSSLATQTLSSIQKSTSSLLPKDPSFLPMMWHNNMLHRANFLSLPVAFAAFETNPFISYLEKLYASVVSGTAAASATARAAATKDTPVWMAPPRLDTFDTSPLSCININSKTPSFTPGSSSALKSDFSFDPSCLRLDPQNVFSLEDAVTSFKSSVQVSAPTLTWFLFLFNNFNRILTVVFLIYHPAVFLIVGSMLVMQTINVSRNITSNETWFHERYPWTFKMGGAQVYTVFNRGAFENLKEFFLWPIMGSEFVYGKAVKDGKLIGGGEEDNKKEIETKFLSESKKKQGLELRGAEQGGVINNNNYNNNISAVSMSSDGACTIVPVPDEDVQQPNENISCLSETDPRNITNLSSHQVSVARDQGDQYTENINDQRSLEKRKLNSTPSEPYFPFFISPAYNNNLCLDIHNVPTVMNTYLRNLSRRRAAAVKKNLEKKQKQNEIKNAALKPADKTMEADTVDVEMGEGGTVRRVVGALSAGKCAAELKRFGVCANRFTGAGVLPEDGEATGGGGKGGGEGGDSTIKGPQAPGVFSTGGAEETSSREFPPARASRSAAENGLSISLTEISASPQPLTVNAVVPQASEAAVVPAASLKEMATTQNLFMQLLGGVPEEGLQWPELARDVDETQRSALLNRAKEMAIMHKKLMGGGI